MTDTYARPYSTTSLISPHDALEALAAKDRLDLGDFPPSPDEPTSSPARQRAPTPNGAKAAGINSTPRAGANGGARRTDVPPQTPPIEDHFAGRNFVRAIFDFEATDPSALSFRAGDIIEVITQLESGWWDGLLGKERGWFPSNYVQVVNAREILDQVELDEDDEVGPQSSTSGTSGSGTMRGVQSGPVPGKGSGSRARLSNIGEDLGLDWDRDDFSSSVGLGDLAREMMGHDEEDDFAAAAADRRKRLETDAPDEFQVAADDRKRRQERMIEGDGTPTMDDFSPAKWGRQRHQTDETLRGLKPGTVDSTGSRGNGEMDAWIPSMTPDGQVYYHNELTGEDAWEMPTRLSSEDSDTYEGEEDDFFNSFQGPSSSGPSPAAYARPPSTSTDPDTETFQAPPKSLPEPWIAKMTDDGRGWYYLNTVTGHSRKNPPSPTLRNLDDSLKRLSVASIPPAAPRPLRLRRSMDLQIRQVESWSNTTRERMKAVIPKPTAPTMGHLVEVVNECLREVFESCVAGSAAEEELSRADDLGSDAGVTLALAREEAAEEMLRIAHLSTLASIRDLFTAFGYVGPLEADTDMARPKWVGDMTLIGSIGLLSANVHAATTSHRLPDSGLSVWAEVMRAASKLKDVIALFPGVVTPNVTASAQEAAEGKSREPRLEVEGVGRMFGGKWGFGVEGKTLRALDQATVAELEKAKGEVDKTSSDPVDLVRHASAFRELLLSVDLASSIDMDGDTSSGAKEENAKAYADLVAQAKKALGDLDAAEALLTRTCESILASDPTEDSAGLISPNIEASFQAISTLLTVSSSQRSMVDQSLVLGQYGHRSPSFVRPDRPPSIISAKSRVSKLSIPRRPARGLEEEFLDSGEFDDELRDQAGELVSSTSGSQTSLPQMGRRGIQVSTNTSQHVPGPGEISATSSTTSLTYQKSESDSASQKGKRSSIMKFMRGRSGSDADDGRITTKPRQPSKKLAKLLGEDISTLGQLPPPQAPPAQQVPETPWYLENDYEPSELLFDDKGAVRAGSLRALVARLTPYGSTDTSFFQAFMFTFRSFTTGQELLENLLQRYYIEPPAGLTPVEVADWTKQKQTPLRLRVCNTLRAWLDKYYVDKMDRPLLDRLEQFAEDESRMLAAQQLKGLVQRRRRGEVDAQRRVVSGALLSPPAPLIPRVPAGRDMNVLDIAPLELARQLTILESGFFQRVQPSECLNKAWNGPDGDKLAPNVRSVIKTANILSGWVGTTCLSSRDAKQRARIMKHFIQTAMELRNLNNFSSMAAVAAGLNTAPVLRLKRSWELCSPKTQAQKAEVDKTLDSTKNFSNYKDMLKTINPPCVPFFGFWLSALTFIEDGNKDFVPASTELTQPGSGISTSTSSSSLAASRTPISAPLPSSISSNLPTSSSAGTDGQPLLINFFKRSLAAEILRDIQQYQSQPYNLARSRMVYDWLMKQLEHCDRTYDLDKLYNLSLQLEPREREEERITRMLHDSGFI